MTKADLVEKIHEQYGLTKKDIMVVIDSLFGQIKQSLLDNEDIKLSGFGNFEVKMRGARVGRNLATGTRKEIPPRNVLTFRPSIKFKNRINEG